MALLDSRKDKVKEYVNPILNIHLEGSQQGPSPPKRIKIIGKEGSSHVRECEYSELKEDMRSGCTFKYFMGCKT